MNDTLKNRKSLMRSLKCIICEEICDEWETECIDPMCENCCMTLVDGFGICPNCFVEMDDENDGVDCLCNKDEHHREDLDSPKTLEEIRSLMDDEVQMTKELRNERDQDKLHLS